MNIDKLFKFSAIFGILLVSLSLFYYFVLLPVNNEKQVSQHSEPTMNTTAIPTPIVNNKTKAQTISFIIEKIGNKVKLTIPQMGMTACLWHELGDPNNPTGANIFATESNNPNGNSQIYDYGQEVTVSALCQDQFGDIGDAKINPVDIKNIK